MRSETLVVEAAFARLAAQGVGAVQIAQLAVSTWRGIDSALSPIIGHGGVYALFKRSVHLARSNIADWDYEAASEPDDFDALLASLSRQPSSMAAAASDALMRTFYDLLSQLIGPSLTERLLRSVLAKLSSGPAAQETST